MFLQPIRGMEGGRTKQAMPKLDLIDYKIPAVGCSIRNRYRLSAWEMSERVSYYVVKL